MSNEVSSVDRWLAFSDGELTAVQAAFGEVTGRIQDEAAAGAIPAESLGQAAHTFALMMSMCLQIDDVRGVDHPPMDVCVAVARMIETGEYPAFAEGNVNVQEAATSDAHEPTVEAA